MPKNTLQMCRVAVVYGSDACLHALLPGDPEVPAREEAGDGVARQVVDPALLAQLDHYGVYPGEAGLTLHNIHYSHFSLALYIH